MNRLTAELQQVEAHLKALHQARDDLQHEVNTALNALFGLTEELARTALTPEQRHYIELLQAAGRRLHTRFSGIAEGDPNGAAHAGEPELISVIRGGRALVADDITTNQVVLALMLERLGFQVDVASNGREALELATRTAYDVVLLDCQMPEMDGHQAASLLRSSVEPCRATRPDVPIVAVSAGGASEMQRARASGMSHFLAKPISLQTLARIFEPRAAQVQAPQEQDVLDVSRLRELEELLAEAGPEQLGPFVKSFAATSAALLKTMEDAIREGDADALRQAAHALRGSSLNVGAVRVIEICECLEQGAARLHRDQQVRMFSELTEHVALANAALARRVAG